jgi:hypothetical protein
MYKNNENSNTNKSNNINNNNNNYDAEKIDINKICGLFTIFQQYIKNPRNLLSVPSFTFFLYDGITGDLFMRS